jgi:hypothetical protein
MESKMSKKEFLQKEARIEYANLIYSLYPRKEGKAAGMKKLMSMLNTVDDYNKISKATINYAAKVKREQRELQFVLLFATFINGRWQDYTDENLGQQQGQVDNTKWF